MKHFIIPDVQVKPGQCFNFLTKIGELIIKEKPDVIIQIGDFADMAALSSYEMGKLSFEGRRYKKDIEATKKAMRALLKPINDYNIRQEANHRAKYKPRKVLTLGNHEHRISRIVNDDPKLDGVMSVDDLGYKNFGWEVYPFLEPVVIDNIAYCHFFPRSASGKVLQNTRGAPSARVQGQREMISCTSGHLQGFDYAQISAAGGRIIHSIICGSCYLHNEAYLTPQGNTHFRGVLIKDNVKDGQYDLRLISLENLV